jgi:hypothetical protein
MIAGEIFARIKEQYPEKKPAVFNYAKAREMLLALAGRVDYLEKKLEGECKLKKIFIPSGEVARFDMVFTDCLIVEGVLLVKGKIHAREILGDGVIEAEGIVCDDITADVVTADTVYARRVAVNKLFVKTECSATESVAVTDFAGAGYVSTGKLTITLSDIRAVDADEVVMLKTKRRSLLGLLWASWWRSLFVSFFYGGAVREEEVHSDAQASIEEIPGKETAA